MGLSIEVSATNVVPFRSLYDNSSDKASVKEKALSLIDKFLSNNLEGSLIVSVFDPNEGAVCAVAAKEPEHLILHRWYLDQYVESLLQSNLEEESD